jgi:hypothetical protein
MAAAGFTPISLYYTTTSGAGGIPSAGNLVNGELAINITDGKLYYKDNGGTVRVIATKATGTIGGSTTQVQYNNAGVLAGSSNLTFDGTSLTLGGNPTLSAGTANGVLYLNGSKVATSGSALTFDGTTLQFSNSTLAAFNIYNSSAATDEKNYTWQSGSSVGNGIYRLRLANDAATSGNNAWVIDRTGTDIDYQAWGAGSSEAMRLTSTGLGIGTSSPSFALDVASASARIRVAPSTTTNLALVQSTNAGGSGYFGLDSSTGGLSGTAYALNLWHNSGYPIVFGTNSTERARITSGGSLLIGDTTDAAKLWVYRTDAGNAFGARATYATYASTVALFGADRNTTNNSFYYVDCYNYGSASYRLRIADSGDVTNVNGTYGTISDAKMKTDIVDAGSQWADIKAIRFRKFKMKDDPSGLLQLGVVAQELEQTSPGLVDEHVDRDAEGNDLGTTTKSVKTSILLMKAAKALQEAMARIETLEAKVSALEGN